MSADQSAVSADQSAGSADQEAGHRNSHGPIMAAARASAVAQTQEFSSYLGNTIVITLPTISTDPLDELIERIRPKIAAAVDALQVAAFLEAEGVSDRNARVEYGFTDVFRLAEEVYRSLGPCEPVAWQPATGRPQRGRIVRDLLHGPLYLLPTVVFPAVLSVVGQRSLVVGLVLAGGLAWVLAGATSWMAYRLLGAGCPGQAGWVLRWSTVAGLPLAALLGLVLAEVTGGRVWLIALAVGQMAYQMASTLLMFYQRELLLIPVMVPAVAAGGAYLAFGSALAPLALATAGGSIGVALILGLRETTRHRRERQAGLRHALRRDLPTLSLVTVYAACSAAFLLHVQVPYLLGRVDIAFAVLPLMVGMGVVEWRARQFAPRAKALLPRMRLPRDFTRKVWSYLCIDLVWCFAAVVLAAIPVLTAMGRWYRLSPATVIMTLAYALVASGYFLSFVVAERARYGWLGFAFGLATTVHVTARALLAAPTNPFADALWYLGSAALLQVLLLAALAPVVGQVWRYR